ncbi:MAG: hypothetical protein MI717_14785 [Spirochaetales bacterium]|nr:hypothetical protein [Spirochaetales bacterium]
MVKKELIGKSPLRKLDDSISGGLGVGNVGVIASRRGIGKTACLVHIATDKLMAGKHVIHVSYAKRVDHIISWYEDIFREISQKRNLENAMDVHDDIVRNRVIMNFNQEGTSVSQVIAGVSAMMDAGGISTDAVVIDGFDFTKASAGDLSAYKAFAVNKGIELWFTDDYHREDIDGPVLNEDGIPENLVSFLQDIQVIVTLKAEKDYLHLCLVKDHDRIITEDLPLRLDPKSLLVAEL